MTIADSLGSMVPAKIRNYDAWPDWARIPTSRVYERLSGALERVPEPVKNAAKLVMAYRPSSIRKRLSEETAAQMQYVSEIPPPPAAGISHDMSKYVPYEAPYSNGIPVVRLELSQLRQSMQDYKHSPIFLYTHFGGKLTPYRTFSVHPSFLDGKILVPEVFDDNGRLNMNKLVLYAAQKINGRSPQVEPKQEDNNLAAQAAKFYAFYSLGFRLDIDGKNPKEYHVFTHLSKSATADEVRELTGGLELKVRGNSIVIPDTSIALRIDCGLETIVDNTHVRPMDRDPAFVGRAKLEKPSSPRVDRSLSQGHPLVVSLDSEMQKRLLAFQVNNGAEDELSASILGYAARAGILREITSQILVYPSLAS